MCFKSKVKTPKVSTALPAPEPVLQEEPKGIDFGGEDSGAENSSEEDTTEKVTKIDREGSSSDVPSAFSTASSTKRKKTLMSTTAVRKAISR